MLPKGFGDLGKDIVDGSKMPLPSLHPQFFWGLFPIFIPLFLFSPGSFPHYRKDNLHECGKLPGLLDVLPVATCLKAQRALY